MFIKKYKVFIYAKILKRRLIIYFNNWQIYHWKSINFLIYNCINRSISQSYDFIPKIQLSTKSCSILHLQHNSLEKEWSRLRRLQLEQENGRFRMRSCGWCLMIESVRALDSTSCLPRPSQAVHSCIGPMTITCFFGPFHLHLLPERAPHRRRRCESKYLEGWTLESEW